MKILHIAPNAPYNDYWGYQDNLLPHYHKKLGHDVTLIITNRMHKDGKIVETDCKDYFLNDGVRVIRRKTRNYGHKILNNVKSKFKVYPLICDIMPDFIFFHGVSSDTIYDVIKYKKKINKDCIIVQDNHLDYNIGFQTKTFRNKIIREIMRFRVLKTHKYIDKFYGVTPWRCDYLIDYFKTPPEKVDLLIMGGDDEKINFNEAGSIRREIREKYNLSETDFLIITGGKIDKKKNIHYLMEAVSESELPNIKLLIFGNVIDDVKEDFEKFLNNKNIFYIGWIDADKAYDYFLASDLVFFPGQHSVLWEQACACGIPGVYMRWEGMNHIDAGGNVMFLDEVNVDTVTSVLNEIVLNEDKYSMMKKNAVEKGIKEFSYLNIAKKSLNV